MSTSQLPHGWLLLLYTLPASKTAGRVNLWRKLKKSGAYALKTSGYVLPDEPAHLERFQWLVQQVRDDGGDATLARVNSIEGLTSEDLVGLFNEARASDYAALTKPLQQLIAAHRKKAGKDFAEALEKLQRQFQEVRAIDYFSCPDGHDVEVLLERAARLSAPPRKPGRALDTKPYRRRLWLTRPHPEIDRVGSAWLIRKFIDPQARFVFAAKPSAHPGAIPYDMMDVEFTHHGDACTFETLLMRFAIADPAVRRIGEMIHDADLEDAKFQRPECIGLDLLFKGWARLGHGDAEVLDKGFACFDALYAALRKKSEPDRNSP
ncbi:MAG: chromate resistance protein ChrB domain-containing protein [Chthoniobacter sp.]|uniref:chromate resistance protein ChrB domain-containing protein n=1 Tax=Chthoniobacter sp. TaxID=2510640 RepID=UPI0032ACA7AA